MSMQYTNQSNDDSDYVPDSPSKRRIVCVMLGYFLNVASTPAVRAIPLSLDNSLSATVFRFGSTYDNDVFFLVILTGVSP